ncbi:hypothetical protein NBE98_03095 [Clostridium swellfunianum]|uniref:hypothetical protein n=1 Tax=Clostridium swellfunianum TaxID=1367462 RepID=UPI00202F3E29|nr:hypothetical protein [Clostridium swellfunianum]MCM0647361.1 hypothetical protein [Clostridium swellfunianum]
MRKISDNVTSYDIARIYQLGYVLINTSDEYRRRILIDKIIPELGVQKAIRILSEILVREIRSSKGRDDCLGRLNKLEKDINLLEACSTNSNKNASRKEFIINDGWVERVRNCD